MKLKDFSTYQFKEDIEKKILLMFKKKDLSEIVFYQTKIDNKEVPSILVEYNNDHFCYGNVIGICKNKEKDHIEVRYVLDDNKTIEGKVDFINDIFVDECMNILAYLEKFFQFELGWEKN